MKKSDLVAHAKRMAEKGRPGAAYALAALEAPAVTISSEKGDRSSRRPSCSIRIRAGEISIEQDGRTTSRVVDFAHVAGVGTRQGDRLELVLPFPPRTKKNSKVHYTRQSAAYVRFRNAVIRHLRDVAPLLGLPLPDQHYNIAAVYYVDRRGEAADRPGLDQGLFDALQDAGVVTNDWQFRTTEGTRIVFGDPSPRVELTITPMSGESGTGAAADSATMESAARRDAPS